MEIINRGIVNVNNLYVGIKSTDMYFVDFGDSDVIDEYGLFENNNYNFGIEGRNKYDVFTDLSDGKKVLINGDKVLTTAGKDVNMKVVGLTRYVDLLKKHYNEIRDSRRFRACFELLKYIEGCNELGQEPLVDLKENAMFLKALSQCDQLYYFSFGYPIEAVQYFEELQKPKPLIFEFKGNRIVTRTRCRKKDENKNN